MQSLFFPCMKESDKRGSARRVALMNKGPKFYHEIYPRVKPLGSKLKIRQKVNLPCRIIVILRVHAEQL